MNQVVDRRRFCGIASLLALGGLVVPGCGEDMSTPKNIVPDKPPLESAKDSMQNYMNRQAESKKKK